MEFEHIQSSYDQKVFTLHVGGEATHVMSIQDEPFPQYATGGLYQDLSALAKRDPREMHLQDFGPPWLDMCRLQVATFDSAA